MPLLAPQHPLKAPGEASVSLILHPNRSKEGVQRSKVPLKGLLGSGEAF
jgi:hypothetical protein